MRAPIALRLATRQWMARPLRPVLCSLAIAAAVALIICVGAAMDSLRASLANAIGQTLGVAEVHVRPFQHGTDARVSQATLEQVRGLPEVEIAAGRLSSKAMLTKGDNRRLFDVVGIDEPLDEQLRPKMLEKGHGLTGAADEILVDAMIAKPEVMDLKVGETVLYAVNDNPPRALKVVGIVQRPTLEFIVSPTIYVAQGSLVKDLGVAPEYNVVDIKLRESAHIEDFDTYAENLGKILGSGVEVTPGTTSKAQLADLTRTLRLFLILLSTLAAFCASLIIGTTLSVGVQERVRQFGQLRCLGASRGQLASFLLGDAAVMLAIGMGVGCLMGAGLSALLVAWLPSIFSAYHLTITSLVTALGCGTFATLLGAMIPIWQVTRVSPMAAVTAVAARANPARIWQAGGAGLGFLFLQILLWVLIPSRETRFYFYAFLGVPLIFSGWCLMALAALVLAERTAARVLGALFRVQPSLLRSAWSRTPWRAGAMIAALMIGVTLFTTVRARGQSLLKTWTAPERTGRIPDFIIKKSLGAFDANRLNRLNREHPEIRDIALFDYFGVRTTGSLSRLGKVLKEDQTTFIAVDPVAFASQVQLDYLEGDPETAVKELQQGNHVFISKEFHTVRQLGRGDKITFRSSDGKDVEFTIAAVVTSTGVELVKNYFDLRASFSEKSITSVLGTVSDAKKYFKLGDPTLLLANVDPSATSVESMTSLRDKLTKEGLLSVSSVELKQSLTQFIKRLINGLSVIGIGALCVASLGVANMVIASIHARRYEFGVLRAIGAGRSQLVRLVLAEVTLIALVAGIFGAAAGLTFAFMATQIDQLLIGFSTCFLDTTLAGILIYALLLVGQAIVLTTLLAWLASLGSAIRGAFTAQRAVLAAGRV